MVVVFYAVDREGRNAAVDIFGGGDVDGVGFRRSHEGRGIGALTRMEGFRRGRRRASEVAGTVDLRVVVVTTVGLDVVVGVST